MKSWMFAAGWTVVIVFIGIVITVGTIKVMHNSWVADCKADGNIVVAQGYGVSKAYMCINPKTGQYVDSIQF